REEFSFAALAEQRPNKPVPTETEQRRGWKSISPLTTIGRHSARRRGLRPRPHQPAPKRRIVLVFAEARHLRDSQREDALHHCGIDVGVNRRIGVHLEKPELSLVVE